MIGILGSQSVKDSAHTVKTYAPLQTNQAWNLNWIALKRLQSLDKHHTLFNALVALIESAATGELLSAVENLEGGPGTDLTQSSGPPFSIKFAISGPIPRAQIELTYFSMSDDGEIEIEAHESKEYYFASKESGLGVVSSLAYSDLSYEFRFTHGTIQRVGDLIGVGDK